MFGTFHKRQTLSFSSHDHPSIIPRSSAGVTTKLSSFITSSLVPASCISRTNCPYPRCPTYPACTVVQWNAKLIGFSARLSDFGVSFDQVMLICPGTTSLGTRRPVTDSDQALSGISKSRLIRSPVPTRHLNSLASIQTITRLIVRFTITWVILKQALKVSLHISALYEINHLRLLMQPRSALLSLN